MRCSVSVTKFFRNLQPRRLEWEAGLNCLTGPNGAGKTTLARLLCGLVRPMAGSVSIRRDGALVRADAPLLRTTVAYVFQNPDYQLFLPTVREELAYGLVEAGADAPAVERGVADAVRRFDLPEPAAPVALLSYGTRKRLQMAVYHLLGRPLVILDEADAGLTREQFAASLEAFRSAGASLLVISHDEAVSALCDRLIAMAGGVA